MGVNKLVLRYLFVLLVITMFFVGVVLGLFNWYSKELPPLSEVKRFDMSVGSEVYDRYDNLIHTFSIERRRLTNINELPDYLKQGLLAVEDKNFYNHWGMDLFGLLRAIVKDMKSGRFSQGASTLTQQLARNMFLSLDKQLPRKIKELLLSIQIEKHFSKDEIMEFYLNKAPFGPGLYGIEVASQRYFDKPAKDLTIPEAALLIGMPQLPSGYYPYRHPKRALKRRNLVLKRMMLENVITQKQYKDAIAKDIELKKSKKNFQAADYFIEHVRKELTKKYGSKRLFNGGLRIYTTIDMDLQAYADTILNKNLTKFEKKNNYKVKYADFPADTTDIVTDYVQGAVFSIEPETGYVRVMIGGRNFNHSKLNRMTQVRRQPGSSFKPILYTTALDNGYTTATVIQDEPICFIQSDTLFWKPHNYSSKNYGFTLMRDALRHSRNIYAVKMIYDLKPYLVRDYARRFGITTNVPAFYSIAIGTAEVIPYQLISAYTTFPNNGERVAPIFIRRIEDSKGNVLYLAKHSKIRVVDEKVNFLMRSMMESVVAHGTGVGVRWQTHCNYKWTAAGKTGTTDDFKDAWFIGYNKKLVTGIWVGFDNNTSLGKSQSGATAALPSWPYIMKKAIELDSPKDSKGRPIINGSEYRFDGMPKGIVKVKISKNTGLLPANPYEETMYEYFIDGTQPTPFSDSLKYNFYPTMYKLNDQDSLVYDLGGVRYTFPDTLELKKVFPDTLNPDKFEMQPKHYPKGIDLRGAKIIKNHKYVERPDSLLINMPPWELEKSDSTKSKEMSNLH